MFVPLSTLGLTAVLLVAGSDSVPKLDVSPSCHDAATLGDDMNTTFDQCMNDEHDALAQLQKEWNQFSLPDRQSCTAEQADIVGLSSLSSYVELLECLVLARDAASSEKTTGSGGR
jgi:nitrate/nitrite-specific signal transduction histidine kinase